MNNKNSTTDPSQYEKLHTSILSGSEKASKRKGGNAKASELWVLGAKNHQTISVTKGKEKSHKKEENGRSR